MIKGAFEKDLISKKLNTKSIKTKERVW